MSLSYLCSGFESQRLPQTLLTLGRAQTSLSLLSLNRNAPQTVVRLSSEGSKRDFFRHAKRDIAVHIGVLIHAEIPAKSEK